MVAAFRLGILYFGLVFSCGFLLGVGRVLWAVPALGVRTAELLELPLMVALSFWIAGALVRRFRLPWRFGPRALMGSVGLTLLVAAELSVVIGLEDMSLADYAAQRDPVSGAAYLVSLAAFALMPLLAGREVGTDGSEAGRDAAA